MCETGKESSSEREEKSLQNTTKNSENKALKYVTCFQHLLNSTDLIRTGKSVSQVVMYSMSSCF